jgi:methyl-accepting chemotaxis protein
MSHQFRRKILTLTLLPLPLVLAVCGLLLWHISRLHTSAQWVSHTHEVLSTVYHAQSYLIDQETGLRGYLYTADPRFLDPSTSASRNSRRRYPICGA